MTSKYSFTVTTLAKTTTRYFLEILIISKINSKYPGVTTLAKTTTRYFLEILVVSKINTEYPGDGDLLRFTREIGYQRGGCFMERT